MTTRPVFRAEIASTRHFGAGLERAAAGGVGIADAGEADDRSAGRQVGARNEFHQVVEGGVRVVEQVAGRADDLDEVVRRHVGRHADGDAARTVDEQVRECGRQNLGLGELVVVVGHEVDDVFVEAVGHRQGRAVQPHLGVAGGGGPSSREPKLPCPSISGTRSMKSCVSRTMAS